MQARLLSVALLLGGSAVLLMSPSSALEEVHPINDSIVAVEANVQDSKDFIVRDKL